jgi:hypothetical protein
MQCNQTFNLLIGPPHHHGTIEEHTIHLIFLPTFSSDHWSISHDFICLSQARAHTPFRQANDAASPLYLGHYLFTIGKKKTKTLHHGSTHVGFILSTNVPTLFAVLRHAMSLVRLLKQTTKRKA